MKRLPSWASGAEVSELAYELWLETLRSPYVPARRPSADLRYTGETEICRALAELVEVGAIHSFA